MKLLSESKIHQVLLKLNKDIPRERALREFLDQATMNGINRKEAILRIFEEYNNSSPIKIKSQEDKIVLTKKELEELIKKEKDKNKKNDLEVLKVNKDIKDISGFDE